MKGGYFLRNGQFHKEDESVFKLSDLTRRVDGFSEFFRAEHNEILFAESICNHLQETAGSIGLDLTRQIDWEGKMLRKDVSRLLNKNKIYLAAKIGIQVYPSDGKINILLNAEETARGYYAATDPGLLVSIYRDNLKEIQPAAAYSTFGLFLRQAAVHQAEELNKPNMLLLNKAGFVCESMVGSFAYVQEEKVFFPADSSGGYRCAIRKEVMQSAREAGCVPLEKEKISPDDLLSAEELFLFDACNGIQKVLGLEDQRYFSTKTHLIAEKLSALARVDRALRV
jgi:branched-subunit amino acid aminotransferase/4-amino-4-deoxychorismate lyase